MTTHERISNYVTQELLSDRDDVTITPDENLLLSGLIDSIGIMSLILFIETDLGVTVPPQDVTIDNFLSINAIDAYLERQRAEASHA